MRQESLKLKNQLTETTSDFDKEKLQERLAKLSGGVAVIRVGAATETEMKESKLRLEDALAATKLLLKRALSQAAVQHISMLLKMLKS